MKLYNNNGRFKKKVVKEIIKMFKDRELKGGLMNGKGEVIEVRN